ncbi:MAG: discoidin domain-containing protein, partial [Oscillospiraceae bacterium]|nr:discoidin domain-containing protein [Oscillospiraceae bacterium]
ADYNAAFRGAARQNADSYLGTGTVTGTTGALSNAAVNTGVKAGNNQGLNGWAIGTGTWPYRAGAPETDTHSGPGTGGMTTSLFWEYYDFTRDPNILKDVTYPAVSEMANFLSKTLVKAGDTFLVKESASPEQNGKNQNHPGTRPDYYRTIGTAFDQQMVYDVYRTALAGIDALKANFTASQLTGLLGFDQALFNSAFANYGNLPVYNNPINSYSTSVINNPNGKLGTVYTSFENLLKDQINKLEPVIIGRSGQVKEYREESFYLVNGATGASIGDPTHRHISNLIGLYPGTVINSTTPHWFDGAKVTLNERGDGGTGWAIGHKFNFWARMADGNRAYALYRNLIRTSVYENLWGMHAPFQIDANFAATAGVAEMLLGSHEGFISLLPSRPDKWATGSFRGLTARGGFEVDAVWSNQQAQQFAVKSNAGEVCALKYFNIAGAVVKDSKGNTVSFTADGTDLISFPTVKGETYTVTDIPAFTKTAPPADLQLSTNSAGAQLSWNASPDAASYNVYVAEGSQPDYTLLANVGEELDFTAPKNGTYAGGFQFSPTADQFTFRVTAVAADGRESEGVTQLLIPPLAPASAAGVFGSGGVLGVTVTLDPRAVASSYKLYERVGTTSTYNQIAVSDYPILYATGTDSAREYYVTAYNAFTGESARARVTPQTTQPAIDNVFKGKPFTFAAKGGVDVALDSHPIARIVDGDRTSRFAMDDGKWNNVASPRTFTLEIDLLNEYALDSITFYEFQERTTTYEFRVWSQGKWTDIPASGWSKSAVTSQSNPENTRIYTITFTNPKPVAEKIQVILGGNSAPTFYEIECKTAVTAAVDKSALLALIHEADAVDRQKGFGVNWPPAKYTEYTTAKSNALTTLTSGAADQNRVNANITALRAILDQADALSRAALPDLIAKAEAYIAGKTGLEKQVAQALINTVLAEAKAVTSAAPLADVHTALYKLNTALNKADAEIGARTALFGLIADAAQFLQNMNTSSPLHDPVLEQEIKDAKAFAEQVSAADSPMAALSEVLFAANRLQKAMDAYTTAAGAELTLSLPDGGIFTAAQTLTLTCPSGNITDFYYTIDGSTPTTASRKVLDKAISLPHGFYTLKAAGFINNAAVTNIAEAKFFVVKTDNVVRGATMTATSSLADPPVSVPEFAPASAADGSVSSRWANQGGSPMWLQADIGRQVTVDTVIIHDFLEAVDPTTRLGSNFTIQVQSGASWQTLYTGSAEIIGTVPLGSAAGITGGLKQRAGEQRQVYAIKLAAPVTGQVFRLNDMGGGATIWEFELYEPDTTPPPSNDANLSALSVSPGTLTPAFNPATLNYAVSLPAGTNSITVSATANHAEAKISGDGVRALIPGVNTLPVAVLAQDETTTRTYTITVTVGEPLPGTPPTITGPAGMTVRGKYEAVSTDPFVIGGTAPVTVTKTSGDGKIVWNSDTLSLDIQAGLAPGVYETVLKASNGIAPDAECTFILTVALPWGNVSGSGTLNISDARMVLQHLVDKIKLSEELQDLADVDGKDGVTITDARLILQRLVEKIPAFPREITP